MFDKTFNLSNPIVIGQVAMAVEAACRQKIKGAHDVKVVIDADRVLRIEVQTTESSRVSRMLFELLPPVLAKSREIVDYAQLLLEERLEVKDYGADWAQHIKTSKEAAFLEVYFTKYYENPWFDMDPVFVHTTEDSTLYALSNFNRVNRDEVGMAINTLQAVLSGNGKGLLTIVPDKE